MNINYHPPFGSPYPNYNYGSFQPFPQNPLMFEQSYIENILRCIKETCTEENVTYLETLE